MSLATELQEEQVNHLDLSGFSLMTSGSSVRDTLTKLREERHNVCLIVDDAGTLVGIFTERDALRKVAPTLSGAEGVLEQSIDSVMTANPISVSPETSAAEALALMNSNHFRNLPAVKADGTIVGNMTHQAVISYLASRYPVEILNRPLESDRFPVKPEGG